MTKDSLHIIAIGGYQNTVATAQTSGLDDLKPLIKERTGKNIRRVTRFTQLAILGALDCCKNGNLPGNTGVYFASCRGDTAVTVDLLNELVRDQHPPSPLTFVNSVSNASCFHVANCLSLHGSSNFVTNRFDPWFAIAKLAQLDLSMEAGTHALVGTVDSLSEPLSDHCQRLHVDPGIPLTEASHWMVLSRGADQSLNSLAEINELLHFGSVEELLDWLSSNVWDSGDVLGRGQHLSSESLIKLQSVSQIEDVFSYCFFHNEKEGFVSGYYDSPTAESLIRFISERRGRRLVHVNSEPGGRFTVVVLTLTEK